MKGTDLTNFTVTATLARVGDVLAYHRLFALDDSSWAEFQTLLDRAVAQKPRRAALFAEPSIVLSAQQTTLPSSIAVKRL